MGWDGMVLWDGNGLGWAAGLVLGRAWTGRTADGRSVSRGGGYSGQTLHGRRSSRSSSGKAHLTYLAPRRRAAQVGWAGLGWGG